MAFKTNYLGLWLNAGQKYFRLLQGEHSAILSTFIKLPVVIKTFVLSNFEWLFYTGFTVLKSKLVDNLLAFYDFLPIEQSASYSRPWRNSIKVEIKYKKRKKILLEKKQKHNHMKLT